MNFPGGTDCLLWPGHAASTGSIQTSDSSSLWIENPYILCGHRWSSHAEQVNPPVCHSLTEVSSLNLFKIKAPVICALPSRVRGLTGGLLVSHRTTRIEPDQDADETHTQRPRNQRAPEGAGGRLPPGRGTTLTGFLQRTTKPGPRLESARGPRDQRFSCDLAKKHRLLEVG